MKSAMSGSGCLGLPDLSKISLESKFKDNDQTLRDGNLEAAERRQKETALKIRIFGGLALASLLALAAMPAAHADEFDQATLLNFSQAVRIPGQVLPAGSYWFKIIDHGNVPGVVQIFKSDRTTLVGTLITANAERSEATGDTVVAFAHSDSSSNLGADVPALKKWFYPDRSIGYEFIYSNQSEKEFQHKKEAIVTAQPSSNGAAFGD
jgi:hypothetical protein